MRSADLGRLVLLAAIWGGSFLFVRMAVDATAVASSTRSVNMTSIGMIARRLTSSFCANRCLCRGGRALMEGTLAGGSKGCWTCGTRT